MIATPLYRASYWASFGIFTLGWSLRVAHRERVPAAGPVLLLCNHHSHLDPWLAGLASPRPLTYLARSTLFKNRWFAALIRAYGALPIDRDFGREGLEAVARVLKEGRIVVMFPEGTRSEDGHLQPLKAGVALLLKRADAIVVPCGIAGTYAAWSRHAKGPIPSPLFLPDAGRSIAVSFGEPVPLGTYKAMKREAILTDLQERIAVQYGAAEKLRRKPWPV